MSKATSSPRRVPSGSAFSASRSGGRVFGVVDDEEDDIDLDIPGRFVQRRCFTHTAAESPIERVQPSKWAAVADASDEDSGIQYNTSGLGLDLSFAGAAAAAPAPRYSSTFTNIMFRDDMQQPSLAESFLEPPSRLSHLPLNASRVSQAPSQSVPARAPEVIMPVEAPPTVRGVRPCTYNLSSSMSSPHIHACSFCFCSAVCSRVRIVLCAPARLRTKH